MTTEADAADSEAAKTSGDAGVSAGGGGTSGAANGGTARQRGPVYNGKTIADLEHHMLRRLGYEVTALTSSRELLEIFAKDPLAYDLVITDMTMPGMTGDKLAGELLALRQDIPIIVCTGYSERIGEENAEEFGVRGVLLKPVSRDELARKVREVLDDARRE